MEKREAKQIILVGTNGTGKSTLLSRLVKASNKVGRRVLIVTPDPVEWREVEEIKPTAKLLRRKGGFEGVRKVIFMSMQETLKPIGEYYFDGVLIFDDCRSYFPSHTNMILKDIFIRRRQKMRDTIMVTHGFTDIPPQYFTNTRRYYVFLTLDNVDERKKKIRDFTKVKEVVERVNRIAKTTPHYYEMIDV